MSCGLFDHWGDANHKLHGLGMVAATNLWLIMALKSMDMLLVILDTWSNLEVRVLQVVTEDHQPERRAGVGDFSNGYHFQRLRWKEMDVGKTTAV